MDLGMGKLKRLICQSPYHIYFYYLLDNWAYDSSDIKAVLRVHQTSKRALLLLQNLLKQEES